MRKYTNLHGSNLSELSKALLMEPYSYLYSVYPSQIDNWEYSAISAEGFMYHGHTISGYRHLLQAVQHLLDDQIIIYAYNLVDYAIALIFGSFTPHFYQPAHSIIYEIEPFDIICSVIN